MNRKKTILTAVVLLLVILIGGMLAYFTDTETRTNVFTIGNINIELKEDGWTNSKGTEYTKAEAQNIAPNTTVAKNPTIKNIGVSGAGNKAYVFLKVEVPYANVTVDGTKANQDIYTFESLDSTHWTELTIFGVTGNGTHVYAYGSSSAMTALGYNKTTEALFTGVKLKNLDDVSELGTTSANITVTAYGIQTSDLGVTDPAQIFALFN